jgi:hypothetical protein
MLLSQSILLLHFGQYDDLNIMFSFFGNLKIHTFAKLPNKVPVIKKRTPIIYLKNNDWKISFK